MEGSVGFRSANEIDRNKRDASRPHVISAVPSLLRHSLCADRSAHPIMIASRVPTRQVVTRRCAGRVQRRRAGPRVTWPGYAGLRATRAVVDAKARRAAIRSMRVKTAGTIRRSALATTAGLNLVFISAEVTPWSKTGGLGDVVSGLPIELSKLGHKVMTIAPRSLRLTRGVV